MQDGGGERVQGGEGEGQEEGVVNPNPKTHCALRVAHCIAHCIALRILLLYSSGVHVKVIGTIKCENRGYRATGATLHLRFKFLTIFHFHFCAVGGDPRKPFPLSTTTC